MKKDSNYSELLKDPLWQKKRLEIMKRDDFKCKICGDNKSTLHSHHITYEEDKKPWEYQNNRIITLCERHHSEIHEHKLIEIIDHGVLSPYDFIQKYSFSLIVFNYIENHKGVWGIEFFPNYDFIFSKIELISNLHNFILNMDFDIRFLYQNENLCDYIKPCK